MNHNISSNIATRRVAELRQKEQVLLGSGALLDLIETQTSDVVSLLSPDGRIQYISASCGEACGYEPVELLGVSYRMLVHPEDQAAVAEFFTAVLSRGSAGAEYRYRLKDGSYRWMASNGIAYTAPGSSSAQVLSIARDISWRRLVDHEVRTPMNVILGMADVLLESHLTADQRECVQSLRRAASGLMNLAGVNLSEARKDSQRLRVAVVPGAGGACENGRLKRSLDSLGFDAREFQTTQDALISLDVVPFGEEAYALAVVHCREQGDEGDRIARMVRESHPSLPVIVLPPGEDAASVVSTALAGDRRRKPLRILVAEDSEDNRILLRHYMKDTTHTLTFAENGQEAFDVVFGGEFDIVLMDLRMPVLDGFAATRRIREKERLCGRTALPIVALSANAGPEDVKMSLEAGCDGHLAKPIAKRDLLAALDRYVTAGATGQPRAEVRAISESPAFRAARDASGLSAPHARHQKF